MNTHAVVWNEREEQYEVYFQFGLSFVFVKKSNVVFEGDIYQCMKERDERNAEL
jgi:hypothetical protein